MNNNIKVLGEMEQGGFTDRKRVYDPSGIAPTIVTAHGGNFQPKVCEVKCLNTVENGIEPSVQNRVLDTSGLSYALTASFNPKVLEVKSIVAMRGREDGQQLEIQTEPICNTLTSVQKDNLLMELTSDADITTMLESRAEQSRAEQSRAEQSRAEWHSPHKTSNKEWQCGMCTARDCRPQLCDKHNEKRQSTRERADLSGNNNGEYP